MPFIIEAIAGVVGLISSAAGALTGFAAGLGGVGSALVNFGLAAGLTLLGKAFSPKSKSASAGGVQASVQFGGDVSRETIFGLMATAGQWIYWNTYGTDNKTIQLVFQLSDGACDSLSALWVNGKPVTFGTPEARGIPIVEFPGKMWLRFHDGAIDQGADEALVTNSNPGGRWTEDHVGAGVCYAVIEMDTDATLYESGIPQFLFLVKGYKCYDPRKDSTQTGGSGAHRWATPSTWEWSDNPSICEYNYRRGVLLNGELVVGMGLPDYDMRTDLYMAAANICDESVALKAGGTEKRYRCGLIANDQEAHETWLGKFIDAMAGVHIESAGEFGPLAGAAQTSVVTITDDDLLADMPRSYARDATRDGRVNAVFGKYTAPDQQWRDQAFPARTSGADEIADGNERFPANLDLLQVYSGTQAQRISEIVRRKGRLTATETIWLPFEFWRLEPGDWIDRESTTPAFTKTMVVVSAKVTKEKKVQLSLREIADTVFDWNEVTDEQAGSVAVDLPGEGARQSTLTGLNITAVQIEGANGQIRPALKFTWTPITDPTIDNVILQYRIEGTGTDEIVDVPKASPSVGQAIVIQGIQAGTDYEGRGTIETTPQRIVTYTSWQPVTSTDELIVPTAQNVVPGGLTPTALSPELSNLIKVDIPATLARIRNDAARLAALVSDQDASQMQDRITQGSKIEKVYRNSKASIEEFRQVIVTETEALALQLDLLQAQVDEDIATNVTELTAQITQLNGVVTAQAQALQIVQAIANGISASGLVKFTAVSDTSLGAIVAYDVELAINTDPNTFYKAGFRVILWQASPGVIKNRIIWRADEVYIGDDPGLIFKRNPFTGAGSIEVFGP